MKILFSCRSVRNSSFLVFFLWNSHQRKWNFLKEGEKDPFGMAQKYAVSFYCQIFIQNFVRIRSELHFLYAYISSMLQITFWTRFSPSRNDWETDSFRRVFIQLNNCGIMHLECSHPSLPHRSSGKEWRCKFVYLTLIAAELWFCSSIHEKVVVDRNKGWQNMHMSTDEQAN